jgi:hypothetical protein
MTEIEYCRRKIEDLRNSFDLKKDRATRGASACAARATATIRQSPIIIRHSMKFHTSAASGLKIGQSDRERNYAILA